MLKLQIKFADNAGATKTEEVVNFIMTRERSEGGVQYVMCYPVMYGAEKRLDELVIGDWSSDFQERFAGGIDASRKQFNVYPDVDRADLTVIATDVVDPITFIETHFVDSDYYSPMTNLTGRVIEDTLQAAREA